MLCFAIKPRPQPQQRLLPRVMHCNRSVFGVNVERVDDEVDGLALGKSNRLAFHSRYQHLRRDCLLELC